MSEIEDKCKINYFAENGEYFHLNNAGNYKTCLLAKDRTYYLIKGVRNMNLQSRPSLAVCADSSCTSGEILGNFNDQFRTYQNYGYLISDIRSEEIKLRQMTPVRILSFIFFITFVLISLLRTLTTFLKKKKLYRKKLEKLERKRKGNDQQLGKGEEEDEEKVEKKNSKFVEALVSFSKNFDLYDNLSSVFKPGKADPLFQSLQIVRGVSAVFIVINHSTMDRREVLAPTLHSREKHNSLWRSFGQAFPQLGYLSLDNFLFLGGYVTLISLRRYILKLKKTKKFCFLTTTLWLAVKRFYRLVPLMVVAIMINTQFMPYFAEGPGIEIYARKINCSTSNFIAMLALVYTSSSCGPWNWYVHLDIKYYLALMAVLILTTKQIVLELLALTAFIFSIVWYGMIIAENEAYYGDRTYDQKYGDALCRLKSYALGMLFGVVILRREQWKKIDKMGEKLKKKESVTATEVANQIGIIENRDLMKNEAEDEILDEESKGGADNEDRLPPLITSKRNEKEEIEEKEEEIEEKEIKEKVQEMEEVEPKQAPKPTEDTKVAKIETKDKISKKHVIIAALSTTLFILHLIFYHRSIQFYRDKPTGFSLVINQTYMIIGTNIFTIIFISMMYSLLSTHKKVLEIVRNNSFVKMISNISFSIYMIHSPVVYVRAHGFDRFVGFTGSDTYSTIVGDLVCSLPAAVFLYAFFEKPFINIWMRHVAKRIK